MVPESIEEEVVRKFDELLITLRALKPNDRSEPDRYWAITITETEKAAAIFKVYVAWRGEQG